MAAEARQAGDSDLATSVKKLRKPSVGAWLVNLLVFEQPSDVERLVELGVELRSPKRKLHGEQIRRVSKEKGDAVSKLVRDARSKASRAGQSVSTAALQELETTLEAAFADPQAADSVLGGRLSGGLRYSGLGFDEQAAAGSTTGPKGSASARRARSRLTRSPQSATWRRRSTRQSRLMLIWGGRAKLSWTPPRNWPTQVRRSAGDPTLQGGSRESFSRAKEARRAEFTLEVLRLATAIAITVPQSPRVYEGVGMMRLRGLKQHP